MSGESPLASQRLAGKWLQWNDDPGFANCCLLSFMLHARSTRLRVERAEQERWQTAVAAVSRSSRTSGFESCSADHLRPTRSHSGVSATCTGVGAAALSHSNHHGRVLFSGLRRCHSVALAECVCPLVNQRQRSRLLKRRATASFKDVGGRVIR